jgi:hypothetical protein
MTLMTLAFLVKHEWLERERLMLRLAIWKSGRLNGRMKELMEFPAGIVSLRARVAVAP